MSEQAPEIDHDEWCPINGCRCGKCGPCIGPPTCIPAEPKPEKAQFYPCCEHCDEDKQHAASLRRDRHKIACDEPECPGGLLVVSPGEQAPR